ncbi:MAG TPA: carboxypeptidase-like regulatory domain-containing protein, partial [Bryobacteraceae bacterium]|nr:carboxypeptidase-like regulatory domain-containing protein [Bryobacteraceae bacterium]
MSCLKYLSLVLLLAALPAHAQSGHAELFGAIEDPSGLPVPQATITATEQATNIKTKVTSDDHGEYHLLGLNAGDYSLTAGKTGFRPYTQTGITLRIGDQIRQDIRLEIGQGTQSVSVNAAATLLETASGSVSYHVNGAQIQTLPLDGRNF